MSQHPEHAAEYPEEPTPEEVEQRDGPDPDPSGDPEDVLLETDEFAGFDDGVVDADADGES